MEEKKRFVPPHLHLNLEILDCVFMITSMFLEIPNLSENRVEVHKNVISRGFRKMIEGYDQKGIQFAPQHSRDYIVFAARFLAQSKWRDAFQNICNIKVISNLPDFQSGSLKKHLEKKFQETALRIYLIESQAGHESFSLSVLSEQFGLEKTQTVKQVGKLVAKAVIRAKIDTKSDSLVFDSHPGAATSKGSDR